MKAKYLGTAVLALALAGCGGKSSFTITGTVSGLKNPGLELANGDDVISVPVGATSFSFPKQVEYGDTYTVVVKTQPQYMNCTPLSQTGTAGRTETISLAITCAQNTHSLIVNVTGLTAEGLQLINGASGVQTPTVASPVATFAGIPVGTAYGITVYQQPAGLTCTVVNGAGVMGDADRADAVVNCTKNP